MTGSKHGLTQYASIDKPWLKYYKKEAIEKALNTPMDKTLYRFYIGSIFLVYLVLMVMGIMKLQALP